MLLYVFTACCMVLLLVLCFHCLLYVSTACYMFPLLDIYFHCLLYVSTACYIFSTACYMFPLLVICFHCLLSLNQDARLAEGYENVPTDDVHMTQVGLQRHWLHVLEKYVSPLQQKVFEGYEEDVREE